ncbi:folylpolyglutamate synthase, mitochondrial-like isoform X2 [Rhodnius prolixus]|uniref:folylpolyglutamate synthase, mitochondrial-like isoform X2 n=1 Tax=Rhodnius prolixus TaxID=13249 RepID=UPI003D18F6BE
MLRRIFHEAVNALNKLQNNSSVIRESVLKGEKKLRQSLNVQLTNKYLNRCGVDVEDFERRIGVIHVTGTKGKGTTCALCESCLRAHGFKTGLFTSPHLVNVTERIRVNGNPLTPDQFVKHFWEVFNVLENNKDDEGDMPSYFKFLTVMAFSVFLKEGVEIAIVEVGVGGELDCTNVFRRTPVVGITSLDLDHTNLLGDTIESIAWQKAGIIKPGSRTFTVQGHDSSAFKVLQKRSIEKKSALTVVPSLEQYQMDTSMMSPVVKLNASLALQLTHAIINWKKGTDSIVPIIGKVDQHTQRGLLTCWWPGRCQIIPFGNFTFYLDGAHTTHSAIICARWFDSAAPRDEKRFLLFNCTGGRDPYSMLQHLKKCCFNLAVFSTNYTTSNGSPCDIVAVGAKASDMLSKCEFNKNVWQQLLQVKEGFDKCECIVADSVTQALEVFQKTQSTNEDCHVLVTGSLHLVGSTLAVLNGCTDWRTNGY